MMQVKPKYKNKKVEVHGVKFDSKLESNIYLKILELLGKYNFRYELQPRYLLVDKFKVNDKSFRKIEYVGDFDLYINNELYTVDSKGIETPVFQLKKKLFAKVQNREIVCIKSVKQFIEWFNGVI